MLTAEQKAVREFIRANIDEGRPCYGFCVDLDAPWDWAPICGYDGASYYCLNYHNEIKGPYPWVRLGTPPAPLLEVYGVESRTCESDEKIVRDALLLSLRFNEDPPRGWIEEAARSGLAAFDYWAGFLEARIETNWEERKTFKSMELAAAMRNVGEIEGKAHRCLRDIADSLE